jgi:hypothetical protein
MLMLSATTRIYLAAEPVDLRKGFDALAAATRHVLLRDRSAKPEDLAGAVWQGLVSADSVGAKKRRQCCRGGGVRPGQPAWERA